MLHGALFELLALPHIVHIFVSCALYSSGGSNDFQFNHCTVDNNIECL